MKRLAFRYSHSGSFNTGVLGASHCAPIETFRTNSPWDPWATGIGTPAYGWEKWLPAQYTAYSVQRSSIAVRVTANDVSSTNEGYRIIMNTSTANLSGTVYQKDLIRENNHFRQSAENVLLNYPKNLRARWRASNRPFAKDITYSAPYNGNPSTVDYYNVSVLTTGENAASITLDYRVTIIYYCTVFSPVVDLGN